MPKYENHVEYKMGVDMAVGHADWAPNYGTNTYTVSSREQDFEHGDADPNTCEHEWWKYNGVTYTSSPPMYKVRCKLCGRAEFRYVQYNPIPLWTKVEEDVE